MKQIFQHVFDSALPLVVFDRDGVITKTKDFLLRPKDIAIYTSAIKAIRLLNERNFPIVIVTTQPAVARGWITEKELSFLNQSLVNQMETHGAHIHAIFSCPHHPQATLVEYKTACSCRKPNIGLITQAQQFFRAQSKKGYMVGDKTTDILAGIRAGLHTILVQTGYAGTDNLHKVTPDHTAKNALDAARIISSRHTQRGHR